MNYKHIFGPVPSRRLGMSLGVDLVPHKVCSLNCVYCECGRTTDLTVQRKEYVPTKEVLNELTDYLTNNPFPDYVTFSGSGEPTLNSDIGKIIKYIKKEFSNIPVAVLTNATLLYDKNVRKEILGADVILPSVDAGTETAFKRINRPSPDFSFDEYVGGLTEFSKEFKGKMWLEVFILPGYNDDRENITALKAILEKIRPEKIQVNTLDRPGVLKDLKPATYEQLKNIITFWGFDNAEIISSVAQRKEVKSFRTDTENAILQTISRRPCTLADLADILGLHENEVNKYLSTLETDGHIIPERLERGIFYKINDKLHN
jgi:wyosine [tRNA(Phe)-imidazoG37] synthetase (radical SAM superfamily)